MVSSRSHLSTHCNTSIVQGFQLCETPWQEACHQCHACSRWPESLSSFCGKSFWSTTLLEQVLLRMFGNKKKKQVSMVGIFSQKRRTFALIQPLYHPLQTRPTLPFPHIGNYLFIVKVIHFYSCPFFVWKFTGSSWPGTLPPACALTGGPSATLLLSRRRSECNWEQAELYFQLFRYDESLLAICNSSLPKLKQDPKEDGWGLRETVYVACFQVCSLM